MTTDTTGQSNSNTALASPPEPRRDFIESVLTLHPGMLLVSVALAITTLLWLGAKIEVGDNGPLWPWRVPVQLSINWALTLMALTLLAASRSPLVEPMFGGLDRAVRMHRVIGPLSIGLVVIHVLLLVCLYIAEDRPLLDLVVPFRDNWIFDTFIVTTYSFIILGVLAYVTRIAYEKWRAIHALTGVLFIPSIGISLFMEGSISGFEPFRLWMSFLAFIGIAALFHRFVLFRRSGPRYVYQIDHVVPRDPGAYDLIMTPRAERMSYAPGKFIFISIAEGNHWSRDLHPFSLSSSPVKQELRLSIREIGDFTRKLRTLPKGHEVRLYGPYGSFTLHSVANFERVLCIGAGIGIAPFLGILEFEGTNNERRHISLTYVVRSQDQAPYDAALAEAAAGVETIDYNLWVTADQGFIKAEQFRDFLTPAHSTAVMLCGPGPFLIDFIAQLRAMGVPRDHIYAEGFAFH